MSSSFRLKAYETYEVNGLLDKAQEQFISRWKGIRRRHRDTQPDSEAPASSSHGSRGIWMQIWREESTDNANSDHQQIAKTRRIVVFNHERTIFVLPSKHIKEDLLCKHADHEQCNGSSGYDKKI